ncbi:PREDICTED: 5'-nucleotidase domain-containing protein 3 [Bison bison bison]|uniref:5'-nucleotidase domain-containing protein 3 n=1 Tax=Bison bison bison TaxID=43346 RepID=A0A6P3IL68_BISBB|nr:PREDICTED: 5'-nucleotidase domain-containing protein 3 [Bison bison bison]
MLAPRWHRKDPSQGRGTSQTRPHDPGEVQAVEVINAERSPPGVRARGALSVQPGSGDSHREVLRGRHEAPGSRLVVQGQQRVTPFHVTSADGTFTLPHSHLCASHDQEVTVACFASGLRCLEAAALPGEIQLVPSIMNNLLNPDAIFSNNEMSLSDIEIYGFDYDYTLVFYSKHLHTLIFNAARDLLINEHRYPVEIRKYEYDPNFAIRGLHYDVQRAVLMKIDAFHYIQLGTVYRGLSVVPDEEVIEMYEGSHVPLEQMSDFYGKSSGNTMKQFMDIFSLPEMTLLSCVNEYFLKNNIDYEPVHLYKDVKDSIRDVHTKGIMYRAIEADIEKYICYAEQTRAVLAKLADHGKKMFLITNSPSSFVDKGMRYIVGKDWRDLFDVVIVQAEKPNFFNDKRRPFRKVNEKGVLLWDKIYKLQKGQIYKQGNLYEFLKLTGWRGSKVLYFGDHIYSDLADLTLKHGWRTGAIIPELRSELKTMNTELYIQTVAWLQTLTGLLEQMQVHRDAESQLVLQEWKKERKDMREMTKGFFNAQFGSLFRTDQNPTYFLRRLSRFADIYMASLSCLLNYDVSHTFYPRRTPLQHELPAWSDRPPAARLPLLQEAQAK